MVRSGLVGARSFALLLLLLLAPLACGDEPTEEAATTGDELVADRVPLPTGHTMLAAGDPYSPVLDERPLAITGATPCLDTPRVAMTSGTTEVEASMVTTRSELMNRLDLGVEGIPINVRRLAGATGTARLAVETKLEEGSVSLLFQAKGTFESSLVGLGAEPPALDVDRVPSCGWGYVKKAYHRLAAVVMVTITSTDRETSARLGCGAADIGCTPSGATVGPAALKLSLEQTLRSGSFDVSVRSVADAIPELEAAPFGDMVALSSSPDTANQVLSRLGNALDWLGRAQTTIANRIATLQSTTSTGPVAPTIKVDFAYYPGVPIELRDRLGRTYDEAIAIRRDDDETSARAAAWDGFEAARAEGRGHFYNVRGAPAATVDELALREAELLGSGGVLAERRRSLDRVAESCEAAYRASASPAPKNLAALVDLIEQQCRRLAPPEWASGYDQRYGIRRLAVVSARARAYDEWTDQMCPAGQRIPRIEEAPLLSPFSWVTDREQGRGIWLRRESVVHKGIWTQRGELQRSTLFTAPEQLALCFPDAPTLF